MKGDSLKLFSNFNGGNTRMVVLNEAKFNRYISLGVTDSRLTYLKSLKVMRKPTTSIQMFKDVIKEEEAKIEVFTRWGNLNTRVFKKRILKRKDGFKQLSLDNWSFKK